jgi:hypothetical protein
MEWLLAEQEFVLGLSMAYTPPVDIMVFRSRVFVA